MQRVFLIGGKTQNLISYQIASNFEKPVELAINIYKGQFIVFEFKPSTNRKIWTVSTSATEITKEELIHDLFESL
jgi:hypothetical protein